VSSSECSSIERSPRAPVFRASALRDITQGLIAHLELHAFHREHALELLDERILRLREDLDQGALVELLQRCDHREPADELRDQSVLDQVFRLHVAQHLTDVLAAVATVHFGAESDPAFLGARADDPVEAVERAAADEQDIGRVDLHEFLIRMLASALGGTLAIVPSISFSSACCTPSPDTSRVIDGLSDLREILSISSM